MPTQSKSGEEILYILKLLRDQQGNGQFATDSQGCIQKSDGDPRTGTFHQTHVTADDIACNVNEVYDIYMYIGI